MNKNQLEVWKKIYGFALSIAEYEPWDTITEKDILFCSSKDEKSVCFFKIWGYTYDYCGISCYFNIKDFYFAHYIEINSNPKNEPALYMQNAITGFWDEQQNVSDKNKKRLKDLKIKCMGDGSWLHFEKYEERLLPRDLTDSEAELLADALGNLYMMLKAVFEENLQIDFKKGDALMRKYAGNGIWHNIPIPWEFFEEELDFGLTVGNNSFIKEIKKMPSQNLSLEIDARCLPEPLYDDEKDITFFPFLITAIEAKDGFVFETLMIEYDKELESEILRIITEVCYQVGKPKKIIINDDRIRLIIEDFCKKTGINVTFQKKKLQKTEEALKSLFEHLHKEGSYGISEDEDFYDEDDYIEDETEYDDYDEKYWISDSYVISVSLFSGCYRHIRISGCATLEELHDAILYAFGFEDDHAHAFFMNNKKWTSGGYYSKYIEDENKFTCNYTLEKVLKDKHQFVYVFDFGEEWTFKCKVLKILTEPTFTPEVVRSAGDNPAQYPEFYEEDDEY
ncbi:MAG: hypothetical protein E7573_01415 [Ruminococcaceae bacterium]|nr:hypothetical protein [Oscillospiraceae bacterium]